MKTLMKAMVVLGVLLLSVGAIAGCKGKEEKGETEKGGKAPNSTVRQGIAERSGKENNPSSTVKKDTIDFFEEKEIVEPEKVASVEEEPFVLRWAHEEIGQPGIFCEFPYYFVFYSGGISGLLGPGPKISKDGILYVDVAGPEGPKLHAIDIKSGAILKSKEIQPGYELCGISQKAIYLVVPGKFANRPKSLLAIDRADWNPLWEKGATELDEKFDTMLLIEKGILYRRTFYAGEKKVPVNPEYPARGYRVIPQYKTEIGLLNEVTGKPEPLWDPKDTVHVGQSSGIVSPSHFKTLFVAKYISAERGSVKSTYTSSVFDLSSGQVLSTKDWSAMPKILGQCEADSKFFITAEGHCIISIDMNTGDVKWETEKLITSPWFVGATRKVLLVYGRVEQRGTDYTLWYGIDATNGKILWKKWAKIGYEKGIVDPFFIGDGAWTEMVDEILLIGRGNQLVLIDALTSEIMTQQEEFPMAMWWGGYFFYKAVYKDILIIGTPNGVKAYQIRTPKEVGPPELAAAVPSPSERKSEEKKKFDKTETKNYSKEQLVDALEDIRNAMIKKINLEVDITAQCFTSVKEYKRAKLLADVLRPVLRVIQGTLSVISKIGDAKTLSGKVKSSLDNAEYVSEAASLFFMINGLREAGEKLYYAIDDTAGYVNTVKDMLEAADQTTVIRMDPPAYKLVIKQYLDSQQGTPLIIARTSKLTPDNKPAQGALMLIQTIRGEFRTIIDQIQQSELPQDFPLDDAVAEIQELKKQIVESGVHNVDVRYSIYHRSDKVQQSRKLGAMAEHNKAFAAVAGALADRLKLEIYAECAELAASGSDAAYIVTYNIPGTREVAKMTQQVSLLPGIVIEGKKMFTVDPEEEFYQMPQEMVFSLAIEFSSLWRIADDTVFSLMQVLEKEQDSEVEKEQINNQNENQENSKLNEMFDEIKEEAKKKAVKTLFDKLFKK